MKKFAFSKSIFENLVKHLVEIEENKNELLETYFPESSRKRNEFLKILNNYLAQINTVIQNTSISENTNNDFPYVIIGSDVEVADLNDQKVYSFRIVSPFDVMESIESNDVSYLSPVGMSLLLKKVGTNVVISTPGGECRYKIQSIKLPRSWGNKNAGM